MAQFTDYHSPYAEAWAHFFQYIRWDAKVPRVVVEIGTYEGSSTAWILQHLLQAPESRLFCIDAWAGDGGEARYKRFRAHLEQMPGPERVEVIRAWSQDALRQLIARGVKADFLYVDGGHEAPTVLRDLVDGFDVVKVGGIVICDDYLWADPKHGGHTLVGRPKIAIDAFTTIYSDKLRWFQGMPVRQTYFQKIAD